MEKELLEVDSVLEISDAGDECSSVDVADEVSLLECAVIGHQVVNLVTTPFVVVVMVDRYKLDLVVTVLPCESVVVQGFSDVSQLEHSSIASVEC